MIKEPENIKFPQYRRYINGKSYFKIHSWLAFEQIQLIGSRKLCTQHEVRILPDRNFMYDLLINFQEFATAIEEKEYDLLKSSDGYLNP